MDFSKHLFRCSSLGHLLTQPQGDSPMDKYLKAKAKYDALVANPPTQYNKDGKTVSKNYEKWKAKLPIEKIALDALFAAKDEIELSDTAKVHLSDIHTRMTTGRQNDIENKYIKKGLMVEEDSITIYSRIKKKFFKKNTQRLKNDYIDGEPDIFEGESIGSAISVPDMKSSWDLYTFRRTFVKKLNPIYFWQLTGYMWLTGAKIAPLAYCLVNTPAPLIESAKRQLWYKLGCPDETSDNFVEACNAIEKSMIYDDIPLNERLLEYIVERDETQFETIKKYVIAGRKYLQWLDDELKLKQQI